MVRRIVVDESDMVAHWRRYYTMPMEEYSQLPWEDWKREIETGYDLRHQIDTRHAKAEKLRTRAEKRGRHAEG